MRHGALSRINGIALIAFLSVAFVGLAQEQAHAHDKKHTRYTLVDVGTLGGPNSEVQGDEVIVNKSGAVVGDADTSVYDPGCDCYVRHAFKWRKGVLIDLGTLPGGTYSGANAINSQGTVVGGSDNGLIDPVTGFPESVATLWKHGEIEDLGTLGGGFSIPVAINDRGQVAGGAANTVLDPDGFAALLLGFGAIPGNQWHAVLWQNGTIRDLGTLADGLTSFASAVNERSQVAGFSFTDTTPTVFGFPTVHPFFWDHDHMVDVGTLGGALAMPTALNNRGQVAGFSSLQGDLTNHAFFWNHGTMQDLGTLGGTFSTANWLNDKGEVVGQASPADDQSWHAFLWKHGVMTDLGTLPGDTFSQALSINAKGQIVGQSFVPNDSDVFRACLWENGGPPIDLDVFVPPGSNLHLHEPLFISDQGEIVGKALLPNGDAHAFVLIPKDDDCDDDVEGAAIPTSQALAEASRIAATRAASSPARLAPGYRSFGFRLPKRAW